MKKVLIVDDSSYMRMFVKKIVKKGGTYIMFEASTKEDAIEMFKNTAPDFVILDINMSESTGDGIGVLKEIKEINPEAVVVIISAVGYDDIKDECLSLGAKSYLKKPFDTKDLLDILKEYE